MRIGAPKEIKKKEHRVGLVPSSVRELTRHDHDVLVETGAGAGIGFEDSDYEAVGATIVPTAGDVFADCDMVVKVKEPQAPEIEMLREGQVLFTYLHLAADLAQTEGLVASGAIAIAYETVTGRNGGLPLLAPMSEVAGRMSVQVGAHCLQKEQGGSGILLGGVPGVAPAKVVVLGGGVSGSNAARMAMGVEAQVTVIDRSVEKLAELEFQFGGQLITVYSTAHAIEEYVSDADLVIGAVLVPGAAAPKLVTRDMLGLMRKGSVLVDIAIDQGGCFETSKATTHDDPSYVVDGIVHYCVANMPGAVPRTSTFALNNVTLPFVMALADKGYQKALLDDPHLCAGLNVHRGMVTYEAVARDLDLAYTAPGDALRN